MRICVSHLRSIFKVIESFCALHQICRPTLVLLLSLYKSRSKSEIIMKISLKQKIILNS